MERKAILVVDPDQESRFIAKQSLSVIYQITTLSSVREAIAFIKCRSVEIILIHVTLARSLDSIALFNALTDTSSKPPFRIFATSSHTSKAGIQKLRAAGFDGLLSKPITLEKVQKALIPNENYS